jgi:hypothetical protein
VEKIAPKFAAVPLLPAYLAAGAAEISKSAERVMIW